MTRRERLEMKLEKRHEWAVKRNQKAEKCFEAAKKDAEAFYGGQPILVGHHSEGKARRLQEKIHSNGFAGALIAAELDRLIREENESEVKA